MKFLRASETHSRGLLSDHHPSDLPSQALEQIERLLHDAKGLAQHAQAPEHASHEVHTGLSHFSHLLDESLDPLMEFDSADAKPTLGHARGGGRGHTRTPTTDPAPTTDPVPTADPVPTTDPTPTTDPVTDPSPTGEIAHKSTLSNGYMSGMDTPNGFNIELVFNGSWTTAQRSGAISAAEHLSDVITGDLKSLQRHR